MIAASGIAMRGKLLLGMPNVMLLDEPTNHLDVESIESINTALDKYSGALVFVSHDRGFVFSLATRIIQLRPGEKPRDEGIAQSSAATVVDFRGSYEDSLAGTSTGAESAAA